MCEQRYRNDVQQVDKYSSNVHFGLRASDGFVGNRPVRQVRRMRIRFRGNIDEFTQNDVRLDRKSRHVVFRQKSIR